MEVPIFKQFHKNVIGRGGTTIKKVTIFLYVFDTTGLHVVVKKKSIQSTPSKTDTFGTGSKCPF